MRNKRRNPTTTERAKSLRQEQTKSERLLWSILRANQLCGLKFRQQHPIGPWFVDFACPSKMLVVEIDGGYHDQTFTADQNRQKYLESLGWNVIRFTAEDVEQDPEAIGRAIAKELNLAYEFRKRKATGSGMKSIKAAKKKRK